jgi:cytochrome c-type protein NapC
MPPELQGEQLPSASAIDDLKRAMADAHQSVH